jgi:Tetratricopeptide repeat
MSEKDAICVRKSLKELSRDEYKDPNYAASLLRRNVPLEYIIGDPPKRPFKETNDYDSACLPWHEQLTALEDLPEDVMKILATFLKGIEFVTWSEVLFLLKGQASLGPLIQVRTTLRTWYENLAPSFQTQVPFDDFFVVPYENLRSKLDEKCEGKNLHWLPLIRLGEYLNIGGQSIVDWQKAYDYKEIVARESEHLLGARDPFTLRAKTSWVREFFWQKRFSEAERDLHEVLQIQLEVLGKDRVDYWATLQLLGLAQFSATKFAEARVTLTDTEDGLSKLLETSHILLLMTRLYKGYVLERQAELKQAFELYDGVWQKWASVIGQSGPFSLMLQTALGSVYRKQKHFDLAKNLYRKPGKYVYVSSSSKIMSVWIRRSNLR